MKKVFKIGCLSIVALLLVFFVWGVLTRKERIANNLVIEDSIRFYTREINKRMVRVGQKLPKLTAYAEPKPFPAGSISWKETLQTSVEEVTRFSDTSYVATPPLQYGPWLTQPLNDVEETYLTEEKKWNIYKVIKSSREVYQKKFLMVYQPIFHTQPKLVDKKSFNPGVFYGWMVYVNFNTGEPLGYAKFQANTTLYKIDNKQYGVGIEVVNVPVFSVPLVKTTDVEKKLLDNFREQFFHKTDSTFLVYKEK